MNIALHICINLVAFARDTEIFFHFVLMILHRLLRLLFQIPICLENYSTMLVRFSKTKKKDPRIPFGKTENFKENVKDGSPINLMLKEMCNNYNLTFVKNHSAMQNRKKLRPLLRT